MICAVVGSRTFTDYERLREHLSRYDITAIVSGGAKGADIFAERYAVERDLPMTVYRPDWVKYRKTAGFIRNTDIVNAVDFVIAFWDGKSTGTADTIAQAKKSNKVCHVIRIDQTYL